MLTSTTEPPLITVTNPVTYFRLWWQKIMGKEGVDFNFKIHPVTAFLIALGLGTGIFGAGRYSVNIPFLKYEVTPTVKPTSTSVPLWKETAFTGKLQLSLTTNKYFLITTSSEAITLEVPNNLELSTLIGKRIFAIGQYNKIERLLKISDVKNLEVLSKTPVPIPTIEASPSATPVVTDTIEL